MRINQRLEEEITHYIQNGHRIKINKQNDCEICVENLRKESIRFICGGGDGTQEPKIRCFNCNKLNDEENVCFICFDVYWCAECVDAFKSGGQK